MTVGQSEVSWPGLKAQLCGRVRPDDPIYIGMVRQWFDNAVGGPGAPLWLRLAQRTTPPGAATDWPVSGWRYGDSCDGVWAEQDFVPAGVEPEFAEPPFTPEAWQHLRATLGTAPGTGALGVFDLAAVGKRPLPGKTSLRCVSDVLPDDSGDPGWYTLEAMVSADLLGDLSDGPATLLPLMRAAAEIGDPTYGEIAIDPRLPRGTAREAAVGRHDIGTAITGSSAEARGYGWLTVLGQELGDRLGGLLALRDSGAFVEVEPLAAGGYWLLATHRFDDFGPAAVSQVFRALSPVLDRTTRPDPGLGYEDLRPALAAEDVIPPRSANDLSAWLPQ